MKINCACIRIAFLAGWRCGAGGARSGGHLQPVDHARYAQCAEGGTDGSVALRRGESTMPLKSDDTAGRLDRDVLGFPLGVVHQRCGYLVRNIAGARTGPDGDLFVTPLAPRRGRTHCSALFS